jgi:branched-chain amino acid transport system substrate-binding protein
MLNRRRVLASISAAAITPAFVRAQGAVPGVTATEIRIGTTVPLSGPAAIYGSQGASMDACFARVNAAGGVNGRKIRLIVADDAYTPNRTLEQTRRLVEKEQVLLLAGQVGTAPGLAVRPYLNEAKVPQLLVSSGAPTWNDEIDKYPWSLAWPPSYTSEGRSVAGHIKTTKPGAKIAILYQNDDAGKGYLRGVKEVLATGNAKLVAEQSFEVSDPTIDSQILTLQASGADVMIAFGVPKPTSQTIRRVYDVGWKPQLYIGSVSTSVPQVLATAGLEKSKGVISAAILKDPSDSSWANDKGMQDYMAVMKQYSPQSALDNATTTGFSVATVIVELLRQCGNNLSRDHIMAQTAHLDLQPPLLLPGLKIKTSPKDRALQSDWRLQQFNGTRWELLPPV